MADIARLTGVKPAAVSNWRRRHPGFPQPAREAGQERFLAAEVAAWLDGRKVAADDRKAGEGKGATYGQRFRKALGAGAGAPVDFEPFWRSLSRLRGTMDPGAYGDLVLSLLYLRVEHHGLWARLADAAKRSDGQIRLMELLAEAMWDLRFRNLSWINSEAVRETGGRRVAEIVHVLGGIDAAERGLVGQLFSDLLARFAGSEGKRGGEFFTPSSVVRTMVRLIGVAPGDRIHDPCCRSADFLVEAAAALDRAGGSAGSELSGRALGERSWTLAKMHLAVHDLPADLGERAVDALREDPGGGPRFDGILTNPPFNMTEWGDGRRSPEWYLRYGRPPAHNANFAWLQYVVSSLAEGGRAAVVMPNGAASSESAQERAIRAAMVDDGVIEGLVALPPQLFHATAIAVTIWLLCHPAGEPSGEILFVDATSLGTMVERNRRGLTDADVARIASAVEAWRSQRCAGAARAFEIAGFAKSATAQEVRDRGWRLNPRGYVAATAIQTGIDHSVTPIRKLAAELERLHVRAAEADSAVRQELSRAGLWTP